MATESANQTCLQYKTLGCLVTTTVHDVFQCGASASCASYPENTLQAALTGQSKFQTAPSSICLHIHTP